jgi:hypothetical protein
MTNGKGGGETTRLFTPLCSSSRTMRAHRSQWKGIREELARPFPAVQLTEQHYSSIHQAHPSIAGSLI